jgi:hypothetical protein
MTTAATIEILQKAAEFGLKLGFEPPDTLKFQPANRCPVEFAITLRAHKAQLLGLLPVAFRSGGQRNLGRDDLLLRR